MFSYSMHLLFWDFGTSANSACRFVKFLTTLQCEVRLTGAEFPDKTSPIEQHHRPDKRSPAWYDMSGIGAASVDTFWSIVQCMISWNATFNLVVSPDVTSDVVTSCKMKRHETECVLTPWQDKTGHGVPFHDEAGGTSAWDLMVHHDMAAHGKTSDGIARGNTTCHTHTSHGMECHDMAWHETPRKWRERLPMILAPLARAFTGVRNPRARPTRPSQTYFCARTTSTLKVLSRWSKASRRDMSCVFLKYAHLFYF